MMSLFFHLQAPETATLFFLPTRCTAYRKSVQDLSAGIQVAADTVGRMVDHVRGRYQYWNATLGADHFYICAHDMGTEVTKVADVGLWKNAIGLVNTADYSEPNFVAHKDVSLPPHPGRGIVEWALIGQGGAGFDPTHRTKLVFMAGHPGRYVHMQIIGVEKKHRERRETSEEKSEPSWGLNPGLTSYPGLPRPDFISQLWRRIPDFSPQLRNKIRAQKAWVQIAQDLLIPGQMFLPHVYLCQGLRICTIM